MFQHPISARAGRWPIGYAAWTLAALVLLEVAGAAHAQPETIAAGPAEVHEFLSAGRPIRLDSFAAAVPGPRPVLVVLHAVDGMEGEHGLTYRALARDYRTRGYDVALVHYFDATGAAPASAAAYRRLFTSYFQAPPPAAERLRMKELFAAWTRAAADAVDWVRARPESAGSRIGLVGFSLGGAVALAAAGQAASPPDALVDLFGVLPWELRQEARRLPPTLIVHGEADRMVPVDEVYRLTGWLISRRQRPELEVYPGGDHMFFQNGTAPQRWLMLLAAARVENFLQQHLPAAPPASRHP